jgi:hypothetical protein
MVSAAIRSDVIGDFHEPKGAILRSVILFLLPGLLMRGTIARALS